MSTEIDRYCQKMYNSSVCRIQELEEIRYSLSFSTALSAGQFPPPGVAG